MNTLFYKKTFIMAVFFVSCSMFGHDIPEPYRSIRDLPFDPHGFGSNERHLKKIIAHYKPKIIIEIGPWLGSSTRCLAQLLPDDGIVYTIDTWLGSLDEPGHQRDPRLPYMYQLFLSNVKHAQLTHKIVPIRMKSTEAAKALNVMADLVYIDGAHDTESVTNDILGFMPHLNPNGIMCGDDWSWDTVRIAVVQCATLFNKKVYFDDNFWWYEPNN